MAKKKVSLKKKIVAKVKAKPVSPVSEFGFKKAAVQIDGMNFLIPDELIRHRVQRSVDTNSTATACSSLKGLVNSIIKSADSSIDAIVVDDLPCTIREIRRAMGIVNVVIFRLKNPMRASFFSSKAQLVMQDVKFVGVLRAACAVDGYTVTKQETEAGVYVRVARG